MNQVPFEESDAQIEFNLDLVPEKEEALLDSTLETRPENGETTEISFPNTSSSAAEFEEKESTWSLLSTWSTQCPSQIQIRPTTTK
jgi:hypothetical protein